MFYNTWLDCLTQITACMHPNYSSVLIIQARKIDFGCFSPVQVLSFFPVKCSSVLRFLWFIGLQRMSSYSNASAERSLAISAIMQ